MAAVRSWIAVLPPLIIAQVARADTQSQCHVVEAQFVPSDQLQIVAWVETAPPESKFVTTVYLTQKVGRFGLGNRPGRYDFNSGPTSNDMWPYGRRITTFPVWAHRHGMTWPMVVFQDGVDTDLSHSVAQSSPEHQPYCRPMMDSGSDKPSWDAGSCATPEVFTDKGTFATDGSTSQYPPRADVTRDDGIDSSSVDMYKAMNPFDAITQATPVGGTQTEITWPIPPGLPQGNYVLQIEASKAFDFNATYNPTVYPSPQNIPYGSYGEPYRGQPSVVYSVPFTVGPANSQTATQSYAGYGDPTGATGTLNPPDATITTGTPGSGASRLEPIPGTSDLVEVTVVNEQDSTPPAAPPSLVATAVGPGSATVQFVAPGDDGLVGKVAGYDIRYRTKDAMSSANFDDKDSVPITASVTPAAAGSVQSVTVDHLLPETTYWIGVRAYDKCHNTGDVAVVKVTTAQRVGGYVDACFVATAAYGSVMASDVEVLRRFRDVMLRRSVLGELAIETYYTFSPPVAGVIGQSELLRAMARVALAPVIEAVGALSF